MNIDAKDVMLDIAITKRGIYTMKRVFNNQCHCIYFSKRAISIVKEMLYESNLFDSYFLTHLMRHLLLNSENL
jgi:hypothetical protein